MWQRFRNKPSLDKNNSKNYKPVSNIGFILKVVEKVVAFHLLTHLELNCLANPNQSAYKIIQLKQI